MYFHQTAKQPDATYFVDAIVKEINGNIERGHWELILNEKVPKGTKVLDSVCAMKHKRNTKTRKVTRYKARLNAHGGQQ
eukprot:13636934-Ditylum_brightwellii.AAC.1